MTYRDDLLEGIVRLWNSSFRQKRNFTAITPKILRSYCMNRDNFDPEGLSLAIENHEVVGMGHAGFAKKGSDQDRGLIHVLVVRPDLRRKGIAVRLLDSCESFLSRASMITMGAMGEDAFYSHSRSSLLPLWGSSEGIGIEASDYETRSFLEKHGYHELVRTVSMVADLSDAHMTVTSNANLVSAPNRWIMVGGSLDETNDFLPRPAPCESLVYLEEGIVTGKIVTYSMSELDPRRAAIVDLWVHQPYRGRGIGSILLDAALSNLLEKGFEKVELVTDPSKNPLAYDMYRRRGFRSC